MEKETIESNPKCSTRSEKREESDGNDLLSLLPLELKKEILLKSPAKSLGNLILVSKLWSSIIRKKGFPKLYLTRSSIRRQFLLCFNTGDKQFFQSCSQLDRSSSDDHRVSFKQDPNSRYRISKPVHGLICCYNDTKVVIGNPSTGQFVALPKVQTTGQTVTQPETTIPTFFGYDPVSKVYKVLCMSVKQVGFHQSDKPVSEEHQVFTIGAKQKWRMIECKHPHHPYPESNEGICKNGVLYYPAWINKNEGCLISFDLRSEDFDVIKLPEDDRRGVFRNVVNYCGKIASTTHSMDGTLDMWVLEDANKKEWSKVSVLVPSWRDLVGRDIFLFKGVILTGELIFTPYYPPNPFYFLCYDLKENTARKVVIEGIRDDNSVIVVFADHEESHMILPEVS